MHPCRSLFWITGIILFVVGVLLEEGHLLSALFGTMSDSLPWAAHIQWLINIQYEGPVVSEGLSDSTAPCGASWGWGLQCSSTSLTYSFFHRCWFQELSHLDLHPPSQSMLSGRPKVWVKYAHWILRSQMSWWHCKLTVNSGRYYYTEMYPHHLIDVNVNEDRVTWFY